MRRSSERSTGAGKPQTVDWASSIRRGKSEEKSHGPREERHRQSVLVEPTADKAGVVIARANVVDQKLLDAAIEAIVVERPDPETCRQNLCLDRGYDNPIGHEVTARHGYIPHIRPIGEDRREKRRAGRKSLAVGWWSAPWLGCRSAERFMIRYDKLMSVNYLGLIQLACGLLWYRRLHRALAA